MTSLVDTDIAWILETAGKGVVGVDIFAGIDQPTLPESAIFVVSTGSYQPSSPNLQYGYFSFQVTVRGEDGDKQACDARTVSVLNALHGIVDYPINGNRYVQIFHSSGPVPLLERGTMNPKNVLNFNAIRTTKEVVFLGVSGYNNNSFLGQVEAYVVLKTSVQNESSFFGDANLKIMFSPNNFTGASSVSALYTIGP